MFVRSRIIYLVPLGEKNEEHLSVLAESIREQFGVMAAILDDQGPPTYALDPTRQQYNSNLIIKNLIASSPADALKTLGVTPFDLFSPIFSHVFGEAQFRGKCAVISSYRLRGSPHGAVQAGCPPLVSRLEKEAMHELGHTFGLRHCADPDCVMHYSVGVQCADRKFAFFCSACRDLMLWHMTTDLFLRG